MRKNKSLIVILLIVVVGVIGLTLAYFTNTASVSNEFKSREYGTTVTEEFTSPENWLPGSTESKTLTVTNSGQVDEAVRVSYVETWTSKKGDNLSLTQGNNRAAIINFSDNGDWVPVTESDNKTYYYYNYKLAPTETTSTLLDSVTFNKDIVNSNNCVETKTETGKKVVCSSSSDEYDGATYKLTFIVETVQYDKYASAWDTEVEIENTSKPIVQTGVQKLLEKVNNSDKTYLTGDRGEMFAFSHPQTEQMRSTTDYRYIGNVPNNYAKFNCDNDGKNCEMWRIIGVFEVDDGTGTYEKRIKLVRGSALTDAMTWDNDNDTEYLSEWSKSSLQIFLNNSYLKSTNDAEGFGLKLLAQSQVDNVKFYLGGQSLKDEKPGYGNTNEIYSWERGESVYINNRVNSWIGKVALMYPSDIYMVYGKGVDDVCYQNPDACADLDAPGGSNYTGEPAYPDSSWIYNSNKIDEQSELSDIYLISPNYGSESFYRSFGFYNKDYVFANYSSGIIAYMNVKGNIAVRPVVYLKSSINIISGDGTEQNPYTLSGN